MSTLKVNAIRHTGASSDAVTFATDGTCTAKITNPRSFRNIVQNGSFQVAQRGTSSTASGMQTMDRWGAGYAADNVMTQSQHALTSSDTGPWEKGLRYSYHILNGDTAASGTSRNELQQPIEAQFISQSGWDYTSASSYLTLSYWIKTSVANNFNHYVMTIDGTMKRWTWETGTISANTWTKITKKIPGNANIQIDTNNGEGFRINLAAFHGTSYTANSVNNETWENWSSGARTKDNSTTWWTTDGATVEITGVQLEVGDVATDFEHRSYADELLRCKRYFNMFADGSLGNHAVSDGFMWSANEADWIYTFPVEMRATPTLYQVTGANYFKLQGDGSATYFDGNVTLQYACRLSTSNYSGSDSSRNQGNSFHITVNNSAARLGYSAEL
tara:strand:- start:3412 stop:4575 length:1164 start_codon:yes stop_codon:yes gene_type:complete